MIVIVREGNSKKWLVAGNKHPRCTSSSNMGIFGPSVWPEGGVLEHRWLTFLFFSGSVNENNIRTSAVCIKSPSMNLIKSKAKELFNGTGVNK